MSSLFSLIYYCTLFALQLQDLAVSPEIRDPSLNTAKCVIQGHQPSFETTGRSVHIRAMLWFSMLFVIFSGPLLAKVLLHLYVQIALSATTGKKAVMVMLLLFNTLLNPFTSLFFVFFLVGQVIELSFESCFDLVGIILCIIVSSTVESFFFAKRSGFPFHFTSFFSLLCVTNVISYTCCWMVIGFKINPTWGLTVVPFVIFFFAAVTYATYLYFEAIHPKGYDFNLKKIKLRHGVFVYRLTLIGRCDNRQTTGDIKDDKVPFFKGFVPSHPPNAKIVCLRACLAVWLLFVIVILAGHSNTGKEMAVSEVLGTVSLYFSTAFVSWFTWKKRNSNDSISRSSPEHDPVASKHDPVALEHDPVASEHGAVAKENEPFDFLITTDYRHSEEQMPIITDSQMSLFSLEETPLRRETCLLESAV